MLGRGDTDSSKRTGWSGEFLEPKPHSIPMKSNPATADGRRVGGGFTLVELLVVITIIVVLAGITFAVTSRVRDQAITATDTGKFRQVGIALQSIAQDNNGIIPHGNLAKDSSGNFLYTGAVIPGTDSGQGDRFNFHEMIDRYFPPPPTFNPASIYNYQTREGSESIFSSKAAKPWSGFKPGGSFKLPGPLWFSFNRNLPNPKWVGNPMKVVPDVSKIVICAETNHLGGDMQPQNRAIFENNVQTRYRVSRAGKTALYLFLDGHVERLQGERGEAYYAANRNETNIWKWW
jgi:prepilin-type N-terminal cleavage/methylation domain-containing protein/prepilin-type processing-associated H-X9-DG protein